MRKTWAIIFIFIVFILHVSAQSYTENPDVFQILTGQCEQPETLTGFRVEGLPGIITALHGVVGCQKINAFVGGTDIFFRDLEIIQADVEQDVALLSSPEFQSSSFNGLEVSTQEPKPDLPVIVIGYPLGIRRQLSSTDLRIRSDVQRPLNTLLPPDQILAMEERNSPNVGIKVLDIEGHLLPGHSGAPIFNEENQVIGIANGGLQGGSAEIVWAIPWHDIQWKEVSQIRDDLSRLAGLRKPVSFSASTSEERLTLKIAFNEPTNFIIREIYTNRSTHYLLPLPQDVNVEKVEQCIILDGEDTVLAQGYLNTSLLSTDELYEFKISTHEGFFILEVTPKTTYYDVTLVLPSKMGGANVLVDGKSAIILDRKLTFITIRVEEKQTNHQITVIKDGNSCTTTQFIHENNVRLYPCQ